MTLIIALQDEESTVIVSDTLQSFNITIPEMLVQKTRRYNDVVLGFSGDVDLIQYLKRSMDFKNRDGCTSLNEICDSIINIMQTDERYKYLSRQDDAGVDVLAVDKYKMFKIWDNGIIYEINKLGIIGSPTSFVQGYYTALTENLSKPWGKLKNDDEIQKLFDIVSKCDKDINTIFNKEILEVNHD